MWRKNIAQANLLGFSLFSITLHVGLLLAISFYFNVRTDSCVIGKEAHTIINSYVVTAGLQTASQPNKLKKLKKPRTARMRGTQEFTSINKSQPSSMSSSKKGDEQEALLALLHTAIQKQQHYPLSAQEMQREGLVTIKFLLYPNGSAINIRVDKSSGTESLDAAALAAVKNAVPFQEVSNYLHEAQECRVDVVFALV